MTSSTYPHWYSINELFSILDAQPESKLNRALYELLWLYGGENIDIAQQQALYALLAHPRYRGCKNLHYWITDHLHSGVSWQTLLPYIEAQLGYLHSESCTAFGDQAGMSEDTDALENTVTHLFSIDNDNARDIIWSILYWHKALTVRHPIWGTWLTTNITMLCDTKQ